MKVVCIKPFDNNSIMDECKGAPRPQLHDKCTVTKTFWDDLARAIYYRLMEFPGYKYKANHFATLPDPSEEVSIEAEQEAVIYQR